MDQFKDEADLNGETHLIDFRSDTQHDFGDDCPLEDKSNIRRFWPALLRIHAWRKMNSIRAEKACGCPRRYTTRNKQCCWPAFGRAADLPSSRSAPSECLQCAGRSATVPGRA